MENNPQSLENTLKYRGTLLGKPPNCPLKLEASVHFFSLRNNELSAAVAESWAHVIIVLH